MRTQQRLHMKTFARCSTIHHYYMPSSPFVSLLLLVLLPALAASTPASSAAGRMDGTWRAKLNWTGLGNCWGGATLIADLTVIFRRDADSIPYPPVLFANATYGGVFLGSARVSAAGYSHGWTWMGVCTQDGYQRIDGNIFCDCSVSLMPATADDSNFSLYMACSASQVSTSAGFQPCLGTYTFAPANASSLD
jgi:hypothetical protein